MQKNVVLGVASGIAAYKTLDLVKLLQAEGVSVRVIMTKAAEKMVDPSEFAKVSGNKVLTDLFQDEFDYKNILKSHKVEHIDLADQADVICIAPATANIIAKIASGIADDFLTTTVLAANSPIVICPSMNVHMWKNPVTQENIAKLKNLGMIIIDPESGMLACGYEGPGRLPHLQKIKDEVMYQLSYSRSLSGKKVLITAGGTSEPIDEVRVITNKSSGKMGAAMAEEAYLRGADVFLLRSKASVAPRYHIKEELFETSSELFELIKKHSKDYDVIFHVAAVSDFLPIKVNGKLSSKKEQTLRLTVAEKIIRKIKIWNPRIHLVGFKAVASSDEYELIKKGKEKLEEAHADAIVVNDISRPDRGFGADTNEVVVVFQNGKVKKIPLSSKNAVASELLTTIFTN